MATLEGLSEDEVVRRYRLNRPGISSLYELLEPSLQPLDSPKPCRPCDGQTAVLPALFGHWQFPEGWGGLWGGITANLFTVPWSGPGRHPLGNFISFPKNRNEWNAVKRHFYGLSGIPNVLGAIDCTHVALNPPRQGTHLYKQEELPLPQCASGVRCTDEHPEHRVWVPRLLSQGCLHPKTVRTLPIFRDRTNASRVAVR
uniref:DDE Tnp4 domain-containing protein n=1 Tax=Xenopus tropicalis TaxID=8364 RepID=A0A803KG39_XENTR